MLSYIVEYYSGGGNEIERQASIRVNLYHGKEDNGSTVRRIAERVRSEMEWDFYHISRV